MRIFVIGATGYIGSAVVQHLLHSGHAVTGLVRSPEGQRQLTSWGARGVLGDMQTPSSYAGVAGEQEAAVHLGFASSGPAAVDRTVVDTLLGVAGAAGRPYRVLYTSGVLVLGPAGQQAADEEASTAHAVFNTWRPAHERQVLAAASPSVATAVIRPG